MKRSKLLLVLVLALVAVMALVACDKTPVHEHAYGGWTIETAPTASAEGTATRKCACGEKETATLASLSDTSVWTVSNNVPATHTQDGCTVYTSQYGTVVVTLGKLTDHKYGAWEITVEPDLTMAGKAKRTCECGDIDEVDVPALENASVWTAETVVRASHDEEGLVKYTSVYGTVEKTVAKGEHSWSSWKIVTAPTADVKGEAARFCTTNGCKSTETAELPVLTDTVWTASVTAATCTTPEITAYTSLYGTVTVETAPANGHKFQVSAIIAESKCTEKGSATIKCTVCGCEETKEIAALGHDFEHGTWVINTIITGEEDTKHIRKCSRCDEVSTSPMYRVDHNFGEPVYKVSEPTPGYHSVNAVYTCEDCGYYKTEELTGYLEQESFWTKGEETLADYNNEGRVTYTYKKDNTQITIVTPKKVAPYDGKTYYPLSLNGNSAGRELSCGDSWKNARITLDETGKGTGTAYPFRGDVSVTMVDETTGKVSMKVGNSSYDGYVDFETGLIIRATYSTFDSILILIPESMGLTRDDVKASGFADAITMKYASLCNFETPHSFNVFVNGKGVTFNAQYVDKDGNQIEAEQCYLKEYVKILDKEGNRVAAYGKDATSGRLVATDGYEGTYTNSADATENAVIDGLGKVVISGTGYTVNGNYTKAADADYFEVYIVDESGVKVEYYQVTLSGNSYTKVKPMTNVHFVSSEGTAPTITEYNTNIAQTLPTMADVETKVFRGWKIAEDGEAIYTYTPDGTEVTFTAIWANKVSVTLTGVLEGDPTSVVMGEGDNIVSKLPAYKGNETVSADGKKFFVAWKVGENIIEEETIADAGLNGQTITAIWQDIPAYVGTFTMYDVGRESNVWGGNKTITIDFAGRITGDVTGQVNSYDAKTGLLTWDKNTMYFDAVHGFMIAPYSNPTTGTLSIDEVYFGGRDLASMSNIATYAISNSTGNNKWIARFFAIGDDIIFWYGDSIYANITVTNAIGEVLSIKKDSANHIKLANTLIVKDGEGNEIFAVAADGVSFSGGTKTKALDATYGTYTCEGQDNLILDGVGRFAMGSKYGTYTVKDAEANTYEAYVLVNGVKTEYHILTINVAAKTYTIETPSVSVTLVSDKGTVESPVQANLNVAFNFPSPNVEGFILKGWYLQGDETKTIVKEYIPKETDTCTFVALWAEKVTLSIIYGNGVESKDVDFGKGDTLDMSAFVPEFTNGKVFDHWYLSDDNGATEKAVFSDKTITANTTVYCAWVDKPYTVSDASSKAAYKFTYKNGKWTSGNAGKDNSTSAIKVVATGEVTISFDYVVNSEDNGDYFKVLVNNKSVRSASGYNEKGTFSYTLQAGDELLIQYEKDIYGSEGSDNVVLTNFTINGMAITEM